MTKITDPLGYLQFVNKYCKIPIKDFTLKHADVLDYVNILNIENIALYIQYLNEGFILGKILHNSPVEKIICDYNDTEYYINPDDSCRYFINHEQKNLFYTARNDHKHGSRTTVLFSLSDCLYKVHKEDYGLPYITYPRIGFSSEVHTPNIMHSVKPRMVISQKYDVVEWSMLDVFKHDDTLKHRIKFVEPSTDFTRKSTLINKFDINDY